MITLFRIALVTACVVAHAADVAAVDRPNVLFIAVDDLRPQLGCYGHEQMHTPQMDRLAARGMRFERAYCMVPTCGASRASLMTGLRPTPTRFKNYLTRADADAPGVVNLPGHFQNHGYETVSLGKIYHHAADNAHAWDKVWRARAPRYHTEAALAAEKRNADRTTKPTRGPAFEAGDVADNAYADGRMAEQAIAELARLGRSDKPFFLAIGFLKPHLPFCAPEKYWDLYDPAEIDIPANYVADPSIPSQALHTFGELRSYDGVPNTGPLSRDYARQLIRGYYAATSYTDALIGNVLDALDRLKLADDTIVVLWGDHGWNLGEHGLWCKHCTFETSLHIPLIVAAPGKPKHISTPALIETIDIYPSLCELAGLDKPAHLDGRSFVPLLSDPDAAWKDTAVSRYRRGDSVRTDRFRYSEWQSPNGAVTARTLFDHKTDPDEKKNLADAPAQSELTRSLAKQVRPKSNVPSPER